MNEILLYLAMPPYLAQWYANECTRIHHRNEASCPHEVYRFPDPVKPVRNSAESDVLEAWLDKQPKEALPVAPSSDDTLAIQLLSYPDKPVEFYNYLPPTARKLLVETIRTRFQVALFGDIHKSRSKNPGARIDLLVEAWMEKHCIEYNDTNFNVILKIYQRKRDVYRHSLKPTPKVMKKLQ